MNELKVGLLPRSALHVKSRAQIRSRAAATKPRILASNSREDIETIFATVEMNVINLRKLIFCRHAGPDAII